MKCRLALALTPLCLLIVGCAGFNMDSVNRALEKPLDSETVAAGLKEALRIGTERSVDSTSVVDGFNGNPLIRIGLPDQYDDVTGAIRRIGLGSHVDEFEISMNRAAEMASAEAVEVFWGAITSMSIGDAFGILEGEDNAATEYFRAKTGDELRSRFRPIVVAKMEEAGVYRLYDDLTSYYNMLPVAKPAAVDLGDYITGKTTDGIFRILEDEEKLIRDDPAARTTELLRKVFG